MRTHGYTVEEAMNMTLEQFMTPESMQILLTVFEEEMKLEATGTADPGESASWRLKNTKRMDPSSVWSLAFHLSATRKTR